MILTSLAFLLGVFALQQFSALPSPWALLPVAGIALVLAYRRFWPLAFLLFGLLWAAVFAYGRLAEQLPDELQNSEVTVEGYIASLPQLQDNRLSFDFAVKQPAEDFPEKIRLSWYYPQANILGGQSWRLSVKLKQPYGRLNPGGFDYEAWMFANRIGASGYVRNKPAPELLEAGYGLAQAFIRWRQAISDRLDAALPQGEQLAVIKALTIGSQTAIEQKQWDVFRITGTTHLIVISGSHISLVAGLIYLWVRRAWAWLGILHISPQRAAAAIAWLSALFYAGLAGYSIPTLRAVIMLSVVLAAIAWQRNTAPLQILMLALLAVLLFDPFAVLSVGFWLSFIAVALLIYVSAGRLGRGAYWREAGVAQLATAIGLAPLLMVFFQQLSLISPLANLLAVPLIGFLVTPLALSAVVLLFIWTDAATLLLSITDWMLQGLWRVLAEMAALPWAQIYCSQPPWYSLPPAGVGVLLLLAPRGFPARYLSAFLFLPLLFAGSDKPKPGEVWFTLLDVGQGLAAVVQSAEHTLVFDTGAKYSESSDMGDAVVLPFLRHQGVERVDTLVVSHADIDHSGGAASLLAEMKVDALLSSAAEWAEQPGGQYCLAGQSWEWDQVRFTILSPPETAFANENDNSCVLRVETDWHSFLLTGDIEQNAETWLAEQYGEQLHSSVLIAPHHGSKTSSSFAFLQQVNPQLVAIPAGHFNRFHFPHKPVLARYRQLELPWLNSAEQGAISMRSTESELLIESERVKRKRYWMRAAEANRTE